MPFDHPHEQVVYLHDPTAGLRCIVAIHSTVLGPALGGTRMLPYATEEDALADVLNLAKAMSYKSAAAGLDLGGGKAVVIADGRSLSEADRERLMTAYGRMLDRIGGHYITTEDVGTRESDMVIIGGQTKFVTGRPIADGGSGDPSDATAYGLAAAVRAVAERTWGGGISGRHVAISGVGKVGTFYAGYLHQAGAKLTVADINDAATANAAETFGASFVAPDEIHRIECDVFAPCALGGALNADTIPELRCAAVVGSANNQLREPQDAERLAERGITYAPDYIVNAGGVINIAEELEGYDKARAFERVAGIEQTMHRVLDIASERGITTAAAADALAEERLNP